MLNTAKITSINSYMTGSVYFTSYPSYKITFHLSENFKSSHSAMWYMDQEQNIWEASKRMQLILIHFGLLIQFDCSGERI